MVKRKGFRFRVSGVRLMLSGVVLLLAPGAWHPAPAFAQQPVAQQGQPLYPVNAKYVNGVAPGYWPTAGSGLTLNLSAGTANCGGIVAYAGGTLTMTASTTNYVYLNTSSSCAPAVNTTGFGNNIPIATVITSGSAIASITDVRTMFFEAGTGGAVTGISGTANEIASSGGAAPVISLANPFEDTYFAPANGNGSTSGIATAISACTTAGYPCNIFIPGTYLTTEAVPGEAGFWGANGTYYYGADTSPLVQVSDQRYGDFQTAVDPAGYGGTGYTGTRVWHQWEANYQQAYGSPANLVEQLLEVNVINGGSNILTSSPSYSNKTSYEPFWGDLRNHSKGQSEAANFTTECFGTGDCYPLAAIATYYGGRSANGDEGQAVIALKGYQGRTPYLNTVSSGGSTGSTSLALGSPSQGIGTQGAGRYLLDCGTGVTGSDCSTGSKVYKTGTISAIASPSGGLQVFTGSGTSWATSTVNTTLTGAVSAPGSATINVASTSGITTSTVLRIFDNSSYGSVEDVVPSAVGAGSITATFRYPHASGDIVASGGLSNSCIELTADTVLGSFGGDYVSVPLRRAFPIIVSTSSTSIEVWSGDMVSGATTAWSNTSGQNGYAIYPCAEAVSWVGSGASAGQLSDTAELEPNAVNWANGDTVELPLHPFPYISMGSWGLQGWWPGTLGGATINFWGANSNYYGLTLENMAPGTQYLDNGGYLQEPGGYRLYGPWSPGLQMRDGYPRNAIGLQWLDAPNGGVSPGYYLSPFWMWSSVGSGYDTQQYDQNAGAWYLSTGGHCSGCTYTFAPTGNGNAFNFPEHIGSLNNDAQGTISISSGTSASHAFSHSYTSAPICVLTPTSDPTSAGTWWVTTTTTQVTANIHTAAAITFTYVCHGNPN